MSRSAARSPVDAYLGEVQRLLERFRASQRESLERAAACVAERLRGGGIVHLFGTGHSHMLAEEVFYRAGGLVPMSAMLDASVVLSGGAARSTATERTPGAAAAIADRYDLRGGDVGIVISHSGGNPAPVEMAQLMKAKGMAVIAVTSVAHAQAMATTSTPRLRLLDVADVVLDTGCPHGDAALDLEGVLHPVGPTSTVIGAAVVQALVIAAMTHLVAAGARVCNLPSGNIPGADLAPVLAEFAKYRDRIRHL